MNDINSAIQELIRRGLRSMEHIAVLLSLRDASAAMTASALERATTLNSRSVARCLGDLVRASLAQHDLKSSTYTYTASADDRLAIDAIAVLHSQWPGILPAFFTDEPPKPLTDFSKAFRLRIDKTDT